MNNRFASSEEASTLVVTLTVIATVLVLLGAAVEYTQHVSRISQRSRRTALAVEIADGHLEYLFANWRNISRVQVTQANKKSISIAATALPTQYFFTDSYNPGPAPSPGPSVALTGPPPIIPLPSKTLFPTEPNYNVTQYRIQADDPMITLNANEDALPYGTVDPTSTPPAAFGPNTSTTNGQYSYFYLAAVDVQVPALGTSTGYVTAKVRRVFEKKFDEPFTYAIFYHDDLELQPASTLTITGPIQTNANLYIGTSAFVAAPPTVTYPTSGRVTYSTSYVNGASPSDPLHSSFSIPSTPSNEPPAMQASYLPYGWDPNLTGSNTGYHALIERPTASPSPDPVASTRFYNQADYRVLIDINNNVTMTNKSGAAVTSGPDYNVITRAMTFDEAIVDVREGGVVRITSVDVGSISKNCTLGMIYFSDTSAGTSATFVANGSVVSTPRRGIRLKKCASIYPAAGLTFVAENPVYIQGDLNTGSSPPSNKGIYSSPTVSGYTKKPVAVVGDSINLLSNGWSDLTSTALRIASNTTVNAALVSGIVASDGTHYSGGAEHFIRLLENWNGKSFTYYGSMVELWKSQQATGFWTGSSSVYTAPTDINWFYDTNLAITVPPGNFQLAAYLQQQRWYQVY